MPRAGPLFVFRFRSANSSHQTASFSICAPMQAQQPRRHRLHIRCARHDACSSSPREKEGSQCTLQLLAMLPRPCCTLRLGRFAVAQVTPLRRYSRCASVQYMYMAGPSKMGWHRRHTTLGHNRGAIAAYAACRASYLLVAASVLLSSCSSVIALAVFRDQQGSHSALLSDIEQQQSIKAAKVPLMVRTLLTVESCRGWRPAL